MLLRLPFTGSYDWPLALRMMAAHAVPGVERPDPAAGTHARVLPEQLGPLVRQRQGLRRIGFPVAFEAVVSTVLGQQVSLAPRSRGDG